MPKRGNYDGWWKLPKPQSMRRDKAKRLLYRPDWVEFGKDLFLIIAQHPKFGNGSEIDLLIYAKAIGWDSANEMKLIKRVLEGREKIPEAGISITREPPHWESLGDRAPHPWIDPLDFTSKQRWKWERSAWQCLVPTPVIEQMQELDRQYGKLRFRYRQLEKRYKHLLTHGSEYDQE